MGNNNFAAKNKSVLQRIRKDNPINVSGLNGLRQQLSEIWEYNSYLYLPNEIKETKRRTTKILGIETFSQYIVRLRIIIRDYL